MQINKFSDFALRTLIHLAVAGGGPLTTREIAEQQGLSFNHLAKVTQWLAAEGYINATRGRGGGMTLSRSPADMSIGALLRESEKDTALVECFRNDGGQCVLTPACRLKPILAGAQQAFFDYLDRYSVADIVADNDTRNALADLLAFPAA